MARLRLNITMSLDGYVAGPNQSLEHPLGEGGIRLHEWALNTRSFNAIHGREGGETGPNDDVVAEMFDGVAATIMGRNMFGPPDGGPWSEDPWRGWWGDDPPYHHPVFVLTHHAREPLEMQGGTTFHFVTDGIEAALDQAHAAAGGQDVLIAGGAHAAQQYLRAGLVDEMHIHVAPMLLGAGARLFEGTDGRQGGYEVVRVVPTSAATHVKYRRVA
jgi:dihydrofolate reductase